MVEHGMAGAVTAGEAVVGEAGHLQVASLEHDDRPGQQVEVDAHCQQLVEPAQCADVVQLVPRQVDVAQVHERPQEVDVGQAAAPHHRNIASPVHTSNNVETATSLNAACRTILSTTSNVASTFLPFLAITLLPVLSLATISNEISSFQQIEHVQFVWTSSKGRSCTINSFDIVAFWRQSRMLRRQSRTLLRHCCWCVGGTLGSPRTAVILDKTTGKCEPAPVNTAVEIKPLSTNRRNG